MRWLIFVLLLSGIVLADCDDKQIDINSASIDELDRIVWVGPATAEKIIGARNFDSLDDLIDVYGIGESKLNDIVEEGLACVGENKDSDEVYDVEEEEVSEGDSEEDKTDEEEEVILEKADDSFVVKGPLVVNQEEIVFGKEVGDNEVVFESKDWKVAEFLPYGFCFILIFIIGTLLFSR